MGLEEVLPRHFAQLMVHIFFPWNVRNLVGPGGNAIEVQKKIFKNGFQGWVFQKHPKTQGFEEIFKEMIKIKFGSLEKLFSKQEVMWRKRKCKRDGACE